MALSTLRSSGPLLFFVAIWGLIISLLVSWLFKSDSTNTGGRPTSTIHSTSLAKITTATQKPVITTPTSTKPTTTSKPIPQTTDLDKGILAAAAAGNAEDTLFYLEQGARPGTSDQALYTPLHFAARSGDKDTIALLLKYKDTIWYADGNATPLHLAARHGHAAAVRQITSIPNHDWPKERASSPHAIERIKEAMNHRFDNHLKAFFDRKTYSAREIAVLYNHEAAALAFPAASNDDLPHAFSDACMIGNVKMMETLWKHNQQRPSRDRHSKLENAVRWFPAPPLHLAVMSGNRAAVAFLLEKGVKATGESFSTWNDAFPPYSSPAHYAAVVGSTELLKALERRKASLTTKDYQNRTPLSYAVEHQNEAVVELLVTRKHRDEGGMFKSTNSAAYSTYLGDGHLAQIPNFKLDDVKSSRIQKALKGLGMTK